LSLILEKIIPLLLLCITQTEVNGGDGRLLVDDREKYRKFRIRTLSTIWMIGGFIFILYMGHLYIWGMIVVIQIFMVKELFALAAKAQKERVPGFRLLNWFVLFLLLRYIAIYAF
jgi:phosphatidate cytidylyltransferase